MKTTTAQMTKAMNEALAMVKAGRGECADLGTLRALARRGLVSLTVRTVRYPHRGRTVSETEVSVVSL